jgi:hypothetical protein
MSELIELGYVVEQTKHGGMHPFYYDPILQHCSTTYHGDDSGC